MNLFDDVVDTVTGWMNFLDEKPKEDPVMSKYVLSHEMIKEYLPEISEDIKTIEQFCDLLAANRLEINIRNGLREMLIKGLLASDENKDDRIAVRKMQSNDDRIMWTREHCLLPGEKEMTPETPREAPKKAEQKAAENMTVSDLDKERDPFEQGGSDEMTPLTGDELDVTEGVELREGGIIDQQANVQIFWHRHESLDMSKVFIIKADGTDVLAMGRLIRKEDDAQDTFTVVMDDCRYIYHDRFKSMNKNIARFVVFTTDGGIFSREFDISYRPFDTEDMRPLCIDFGTSNTSAGSYGIRDRKKDDVEIVRFVDITDGNREMEMLPTIVYVDDCSDPENIKYLFGYEARKRIEEERYGSRASVFYEIKRWMASVYDKEPIKDKDNNEATPQRKEIIKAYIDHVIERAEQYFNTRFKKLHFSAPVKSKEQSIEIFTEMYDGIKEVLPVEESVDEGIAIVYNTIVDLIYPGRDRDEEERGPVDDKSIMIMDCGGGTTDLASCVYKCEDGVGGTKELTIDTCFENGNPNFGGNNITYRIMQLLKIKVAAARRPGSIDGDGDAIELIPDNENDILGKVEDDKINAGGSYDSDSAIPSIYSRFMENYKRAEEIIPTKFDANERFRGADARMKIRRNFHYLWRKAEEYKIAFYKSDRVEIDFKDDDDVVLHTKNDENYYLYEADQDRDSLEMLEQPFDDVTVTINEINRVICGDIYSLLVGLFKDGTTSREDKNVDDFDFYTLSGQSCKISLFSSLLKEYIPGKRLRPARAIAKTLDGRSDLKLKCVRGSIRYVKDKLRPEMRVITKTSMPEIIYDVELEGEHTTESVKLFDHRKKCEIPLSISPHDTREYKLIIREQGGSEERKLIFTLSEATEDDEEKIEAIGDYIARYAVSGTNVDSFINSVKEEIDSKVEGTKINVVFAVPAKLGYGVWLGHILAVKTADRVRYYFTRFIYESFEDASKSFFDGKR